MNGITGRAGGIVGVRVAAGDREYPLRQQLAQSMIHLPGLPLVPQAGGQFIQQSIATIGGLQQQSSTVRTALALIKLGVVGNPNTEAFGEAPTASTEYGETRTRSYGRSDRCSQTVRRNTTWRTSMEDFVLNLNRRNCQTRDHQTTAARRKGLVRAEGLEPSWAV
jgi:hypothetical protein